MGYLPRPRRIASAILRALSAYGMLHTGPVAAPEPLTGPAPGHPERVCAQVPLTPLERRLVRELGER